MKRSLLTFAIVLLAVIVLGRWYAYRQLLANRRQEAAQRDQVERALSNRVSTRGFSGERRVEEFVRDLAAQSEVPLKVDQSHIVNGEGEPVHRTVFIPSGEFTLRWLLDEVVSLADWGWYRRDETIVIASRRQADDASKPSTRIYRLPEGTLTGYPISDDAVELSLLVETTFDPLSWDRIGGEMVCRPAGGAIVVHHQPAVQRRIKELLDQLATLPVGSQSAFPLDSPPLPFDQLVHAALDRRGSVYFAEEPLERVVEKLEQVWQIPVRINRHALEVDGVSPAAVVTARLSEVALQSVLHIVLDELDLTYVIRNGVLLITTEDAAQAEMVSWAYDVADLLAREPHRRLQDLVDLISCNIVPASWNDVGGPGTLYALGDRWLLVTQTPEVHHRLEQLLTQLRSVLSPAGEDDVPIYLPAVNNPTIQDALERQVTLSYLKVALGDVCDQLSQQLQVPIVLRRSRLHEEGVTSDRPITIDLPALPLRQALGLMLRDLNLALEDGGEAIVITSADDAQSRLSTRLLDVRHLTSPGAGGIDQQSLATLIRSGIRPDSWDDVGGPGSLACFWDRLVVAQPDDVLQEVRHVIDVLSDHLLAPPTDKSHQPVWLGRSAAEEEILARLQTRDSLEVSNANVEETVRTLCARHSIPVLFRRSYHENAGEDPRAVVTLDIQDAPLFEILTRLLKETGGGIATWNGILFVTDADSADTSLRARLYPVGLRWPGGGKLNGREFARLVRDHVEPESWDQAGGPGYSMTVNGEWLLVVQSLDVHRQIDAAIGKLAVGEGLPMTQSR